MKAIICDSCKRIIKDSNKPNNCLGINIKDSDKNLNKLIDLELDLCSSCYDNFYKTINKLKECDNINIFEFMLKLSEVMLEINKQANIEDNNTNINENETPKERLDKYVNNFIEQNRRNAEQQNNQVMKSKDVVEQLKKDNKQTTREENTNNKDEVKVLAYSETSKENNKLIQNTTESVGYSKQLLKELEKVQGKTVETKVKKDVTSTGEASTVKIVDKYNNNEPKKPRAIRGLADSKIREYTLEKIKQEYINGDKIEDIAARIGVQTSTLMAHLNRNGILLKELKRAEKERKIQEEEAEKRKIDYNIEVKNNSENTDSNTTNISINQDIKDIETDNKETIQEQPKEDIKKEQPIKVIEITEPGPNKTQQSKATTSSSIFRSKKSVIQKSKVSKDKRLTVERIQTDSRLIKFMESAEESTVQITSVCRTCGYFNKEEGYCWYTMITNKSRNGTQNSCDHYVNEEKLNGKY